MLVTLDGSDPLLKRTARRKNAYFGLMFTIAGMDYHLAVHRIELTCQTCGANFVTRGLLSLHKRFEHKPDDGLLRCTFEECNGKAFRRKRGLNTHTVKQHGIGTIFRCDECPDFVTTSSFRLIQTQKAHTPTS